MSVQVRRRREAAAFLSTYVGAQGELLVDTTNNRLQVHDGATPGGWPAARLADLPSSTSPLALSQGGTGIGAASATVLLAALGVIGRTPVVDSAYTATVADRTIAFTALSAARTVTLPSAAAYPGGATLTIVDESGACSATNAITVARAGSDAVNGGTSVSVTTAFGYVALESNGAGRWTVIDAVAAGSSGGASGTTAVGNGGTGATTAAAARTNLGAAASGANADITALAGLTTALSIAQGGTGATTGPAAAAALGIAGRTAVSDANATATVASRTIAFTALSATRTVALPAASAFPTGMPLTIVDESGSCSAATTITVAPAGSDKVNGAASLVLSLSYGYAAITSNGSNAWTIVDQSTAGMAQQVPGGVAITGGAINGTAVGQTSPAPVAATTLSATGSVSLPANSLSLATQAQAPATTLRGNPTATTATVSDAALTTHIDAAFGTTRGALLYRGAAGWSALAPATSGFVLTSNGSGSDPSYQASGGSGGAAAPRSSVRQTVQAGPAVGGIPSFLPATAASLAITAQNVTATMPLTVAAANGFGATGQADLVYQSTSNPTWSGLTASATNYLFVNAWTGATSSSTLQPIYQFGGTVAPAAGQFTFDYQAMVGYLGNGSAAVATPLVCVGEVVTSASAVTSSIAYAYNAYYESSWTTTAPATGSAISYNANIGVAESSVSLVGEVVTNGTAGYATGSRPVFYSYDGNYIAPVTTFSTRLAISFTPGISSAGPFTLRTLGSNAIVNIASGSTSIRFKIVSRRVF